MIGKTSNAVLHGFCGIEYSVGIGVAAVVRQSCNGALQLYFAKIVFIGWSLGINKIQSQLGYSMAVVMTKGKVSSIPHVAGYGFKSQIREQMSGPEIS